MSIEEYKELTVDEQFLIILKEGHFIDHKVKGARSRSLYAIDKFFVEVHYNFSQNKILGQLPFETGKLLNKYSVLEKIEGLNFLHTDDNQEADELNIQVKNYLNVVYDRPYNIDLLSNEDKLLGENHKFRREIKELKKLHNIEVAELQKSVERKQGKLKLLSYFTIFIVAFIIWRVLVDFT